MEKDICIKLIRLRQDLLDTKQFRDDFRIVSVKNTNVYLFITYIDQAKSLTIQVFILLYS